MAGRYYGLPEGIIDICSLMLNSSAARPCCSGLIRTTNRRRYTAASKVSMTKYEPTIGLELHVQLKTHVKLFSSAHTSYEAVPNTHVQPFDAGLPGALPVGAFIIVKNYVLTAASQVLNVEPVGLAIRAALALGCQIHRRSK